MSDLFGPYSGRRFYLRDFRNAYRLRPDVNPPRQKFQGYVNFIINRDLAAFLYSEGPDPGSTELRTTISSLVRTAELPAVNFKTDTKNQYNRKKIINTGVEYQPVNMTVFDTVGNEWLTVLMRYFSYHYMNPRNKQSNDLSDGSARDLGSRESNSNYVTGTGGKETARSEFGGDTFDSNRAGYNPNITSNFFERIDYVLYHGNKGVQYSIMNPVLTSFKPGTIDYSSSDVMEFSLTLEYESFTTYSTYNFGLSGEDLDRFDTVEASLIDENHHLFGDNTKAIPGLQERKNNALDYKRSAQPKPIPRPTNIDEQPQQPSPSIPGSRPTYGARLDLQKKTVGSRNPFNDVLEGVIDSGIGAAIHGSSIKDAILGTAVRGTSRIIGNAIEDAIEAGTNPTPNNDDEGE